MIGYYSRLEICLTKLRNHVTELKKGSRNDLAEPRNDLTQKTGFFVTHRGTALSGRDAGHVTKNIQPLNSVEEDGGVGLMKEWQ